MKFKKKNIPKWQQNVLANYDKYANQMITVLATDINSTIMKHYLYWLYIIVIKNTTKLSCQLDI